jgi:hypothetical protein
MEYGLSPLGIALFAAASWLAQSPTTAASRPVVSTKEFILVAQSRNFRLQFLSHGHTTQIAIPRQWLVPPEDEKPEEEEGVYVSSFNYGGQVQSFPIGNGEIALHLSSYEVAHEGTSYAAAGRDVFLIFDPASLKLTQSGLGSGITKARVRSEGCMSAVVEHYYLADIDGDGATDIGVLREGLLCIEGTGRYGNVGGPFYEPKSLAWYVFTGHGWKLDSRFSGKQPADIKELPLMGIGHDRNDLVGCGLTSNCDLSKEPHEIYTVTGRGVTAHFAGANPGDDVPLQYGVRALWFSFEGDPQYYGFENSSADGQISFTDWSFDIFSPDGAYVLLLQDHGPYHVVATDHLKEYLTTGRKPDYVIAVPIGRTGPAYVYRHGHWISLREVEFTVSCCGTSETHTFTLPGK